MNTRLTLPEPVTSRIAWGKDPTLPANASARPLTTDEPQARILFVDDEPQLRRLGELVLLRSGYAVDIAADGGEAWAALHNQEYQLLITENQMPHLTGLELIRQLHLARMNVPVILVTDAFGAFPLDDLPWFECGATLPKPFSPEQLLSMVREVLRAAGGTRISTAIRRPVLEEFHAAIQPNRHWGLNE